MTDNRLRLLEDMTVSSIVDQLSQRSEPLGSGVGLMLLDETITKRNLTFQELDAKLSRSIAIIRRSNLGSLREVLEGDFTKLLCNNTDNLSGDVKVYQYRNAQGLNFNLVASTELFFTWNPVELDVVKDDSVNDIVPKSGALRKFRIMAHDA